MTSVTHFTASPAVKALVSIKSLVGRCVRAVMAARTHGSGTTSSFIAALTPIAAPTACLLSARRICEADFGPI